MTNDRRLALLMEKAEKHTRAHTSTKASAVKALVKEGLYTQKGTLSSNYGGPKSPSAKKKG